jgi:acyl-CoA thioester hydrolase
MYRHRIRVRYGECDAQSVVFNAHYMAFIDDAFDTWMRTALVGGFEGRGLDIMVKQAQITWHGAATTGDVVQLEVSVARWGTSSFDVSTIATIDGRAAFDSLLTYVMVELHTTTSVRVPDDLRALFAS